MTPKEKAKQLIDIFKPNAYRGACEENDELMELYHAKQCAFIAVDEIIKTIEYSSQADEMSKTSYWEQIKTEIEKI